MESLKDATIRIGRRVIRIRKGSGLDISSPISHHYHAVKLGQIKPASISLKNISSMRENNLSPLLLTKSKEPFEWNEIMLSPTGTFRVDVIGENKHFYLMWIGGIHWKGVHRFFHLLTTILKNIYLNFKCNCWKLYRIICGS